MPGLVRADFLVDFLHMCCELLLWLHVTTPYVCCQFSIRPLFSGLVESGVFGLAGDRSCGRCRVVAAHAGRGTRRGQAFVGTYPYVWVARMWRNCVAARADAARVTGIVIVAVRHNSEHQPTPNAQASRRRKHAAIARRQKELCFGERSGVCSTHGTWGVHYVVPTYCGGLV